MKLLTVFFYSWFGLGILNALFLLPDMFALKKIQFIVKLGCFYFVILLGPIGILISDDYKIVRKEDKKK